MSTATAFLPNEYLPVHPRKASAATVRHRRNRLAFDLHRIVPGAVSVLATPVQLDVAGTPDTVFNAVIYGPAGERIMPPTESTHRIVALLQAAFPSADWSVCQSWRADTNRLTAQIPGVPAWMREAS
jgi:hypothetical protein